MRRIFRFFLHFSPSPLVHLAPMASAACRRPSLSRPLEPLGCSLPGRRRPPDCRRHRQLILVAPPRALLRAFPRAPPAAVGLLVVGVLRVVPGLRGGQRLGAVTQLRVCEARPEGQAAACGCLSSLRAAGGMLAPCSCSPFLAHLARILSQI